MSYTVIGLFDNRSEAEDVKTELISLGLRPNDIRLSDGAASGSATGGTSSATAANTSDKSLWQELKSLFTDDQEEYAHYYAEGTRRGSTLLTADAPDELAGKAADILRSHNAVDVESRAAEWQQSGWSYERSQGHVSAAEAAATPVAANTRNVAAGATTTGAASLAASSSSNASASRVTDADVAGGKIAVPVVEETLEVGKRKVQSGVRLVRRVTEREVGEDVTLRSEKVRIDQHATDRPLTDAEAADAFSDKVVELTESDEVPVAAKSARVVGEVVVDKDVSERTQQVRDTVRKTDVQVERIPGQEVAERVEKTGEVSSSGYETKSKTSSDRA